MKPGTNNMIKKYTIKGLVQGIGYRPWVARLAEELNINGWVRNTGGIVTVLACGDDNKLEELKAKLSTKVPTGGFVNSIDEEVINESEDSYIDFRILQSDDDCQENLPLIPADIATCDKCRDELLNPNNRRYMHPFISCTICGPRYSIIKKLPYDRDTITMGDFEMCETCHEEYTSKNDRRRHAQTIACGECGPQLSFSVISNNKPMDKTIADNNVNSRPFVDDLSVKVIDCGKVDNVVDMCNACFTKSEIDHNCGTILPPESDLPEWAKALKKASEFIKSGGILAIKDIGGYHLACDPNNAQTVAALRILKHREAKAFAVMFEDVDEIRSYCKVNKDEEELLKSPARPIVLVEKLNQKVIHNCKQFASNVCLNSPSIGAMLPCNPVQIILVKECGPLIMTSGNASGDVLEIDNDKMSKWLEERAASGELPNGIKLGILSHNREILRPMDDSVMKVVCGRQQFIRRGRGHVPNPVSVDISDEIFAAGGDLKSSFCYVKNGMAYVSQYLGDLETVSCQKFYSNEMAALEQIFGFKPNEIVVDMHPGYFSHRNALSTAGERKLPVSHVQHHKAHVASVIAEHNLSGRVLGFAFDGTGYGDDGTIWGSEAFLWNGTDMQRIAHLKPMRLIGGDEGAKNCNTILTAMLHNNGIAPEEISMESQLIMAALDKNINVVTSTSMGRLFDAVSALLGICSYNSYEGQAPIELENVAATTDESYPLSIKTDGDTTDLFRAIIRAKKENVEIAAIARGFINAVADYIVEIVVANESLLDEKRQVVLSGGTFLNRILTEKAIGLLEEKGFNVYISMQLPPGDGGICLGQAFLNRIVTK